jgi:cyclin C
MDGEPAESPEADTTGSHEEFWTFSQVSQWGSHWPYSDNDHLNQVRNAVVQTRQLGISLKIQPRIVHYAQMLLWRFYLNEKDLTQYPSRDIIPLAYESACQLLDRPSVRERVSSALSHSQGTDATGRQTEFKRHFDLVLALQFEVRVSHPSDFLQHYITSQFTSRHVNLAETIISDSFLCPCCLVHQPRQIAEGAAIMAAGMTGEPGIVRPKTVKAISFVRDMKCFYEQSLAQQQKRKS